MHRQKKVIFLSHCILNQNTVVKPLARAKGAYTKIIKKIIESDIGIHQLPCPEYIQLGIERKPMTKEEYDTESYRKICKEIADNTIKIMKEYVDNNYEIVGIMGINCSPTCSIFGEVGILMEEICLLIQNEKIKIKYFDIPVDYEEDKINENVLLELEQFIKL